MAVWAVASMLVVLLVLSKANDPSHYLFAAVFFLISTVAFGFYFVLVGMSQGEKRSS